MTISTAIRWPGHQHDAARAPPRATIARVIFEHAVRRVPVRVAYPDGRVLDQAANDTDMTERVKGAIRADHRLSDAQQAALIAVYDSMLRD